MEGIEFVIGNHYMIKAQVQCAKILISSVWFFFGQKTKVVQGVIL